MEPPRLHLRQNGLFGHVEVQRRDADRALGDGRNVGRLLVRYRCPAAAKPIIRPAERVLPPLEAVGVAGDVDRHKPQLRLAGEPGRGNVHIVKLRFRTLCFKQLLDNLPGQRAPLSNWKWRSNCSETAMLVMP